MICTYTTQCILVEITLEHGDNWEPVIKQVKKHNGYYFYVRNGVLTALFTDINDAKAHLNEQKNPTVIAAVPHTDATQSGRLSCLQPNLSNTPKST